MSPLRVAVAPDSFKGSLDARDVAEALARGWASVRPDDEIDLVPLADGGEGTLDAFEAAVPGAVRHLVDVPGPDGRPHTASWLMLPDDVAVTELACASGLPLLAAPLPHDAHTRGLGRVVAAALDAGARRVVVGLGGSASTDAGAGVLTELGARLLDSVGEPVADGAHGLSTAVRLDASGLRPLPVDGVTALTDVQAPLLGPTGAAAVFGPQKGAGPDDVLALESSLEAFAALVDVDPATPGSGAAGGTAFGLLVWGATLAPGAAAVAEAVGAATRLRRADVVVTGEGRFDSQTAGGKVVSWVLGAVGGGGARVCLVAGVVDATTAELDPFDAVVETSELAGGAERSLAEPVAWVEAAGAALAARQPR
ncbi:glycerate kinase [Frigoribacterium sp. PhB160]|uniref:glycerate kinase n=1 Tax=Frigoribacterium sp. PhB160 TaxID=2485192 RepID=UPI000F49E80B|nr:glycerate kinase [Frigoribacterium sp. PhB160]ROS59491.1 glycerate kinase [Frigoribacterium sp. PhB160]